MEKKRSGVSCQIVMLKGGGEREKKGLNLWIFYLYNDGEVIWI